MTCASIAEATARFPSLVFPLIGCAHSIQDPFGSGVLIWCVTRAYTLDLRPGPLVLNCGTILHHMSEFQEHRWEKREAETRCDEAGILHEPYPNMWSVLLDEGYQGLAEFITPRKKPANGIQSREDIQFNEKGIERIIVENFFGRLKNLWSAMSSKYK